MAGLEDIILQSLLGGGKNQTSTTSNNISEDGLNRIIQGILGDPNNGLARTAGGARSAGLYNSSTENQLVNDLTTRAAGEAARLGASTTTTTRQSGGISPGMALAVPLVTSIGKPLIQPLLERGGQALSGLGSSLSDSLFGSTASATAGALGDVTASLGTVGSVGSAGAAGSGVLGSLGSGTFGLDAGTGGTISSLLDGTGSLFGDSGTALAGASGDVASAFGSAGGASPFSAGTNFLSGLLGGTDSLDAGGLAKSFAMGTAVGGPLGGFVAAGSQIVGSIFGDASIICTALKKRGLLNAKQYAAGQLYLSTLKQDTIRGYYTFGVPIAAKIDAGSKFWIAVCLPFAKSRTSLLANAPGKHILGKVTKYIGEPVCTFIGSVCRLSEYLTGVRSWI